MRCKQVEKLIVETGESGLDHRAESAFQAHLSKCPKCARFAEDLGWLRKGLEQIKIAPPPEALLAKTRSRCEAELRETEPAIGRVRVRSVRARPPKLVWAALATFVILGLVWLFPALSESTPEQPVSFHVVLALGIIVQNITMLVLAPLLLKKLRTLNSYARLV